MANPPPETPAGTDSLQYINIDGIGQVGVPANLQGADLQTFVQTKVIPALKPVGTGIAALQGAREGLLGIGQDISQSTQALKGQAPAVQAPPQDQFTGLRAPLDYSLGKPNIPKIAYHAAEAFTRGAPAMAGFTAGSLLGGGPESPVGLGLGVLGAGAVSAFQSVGPYFAANLKANPKNPDAAWDLSWKQAAADGVISGASFGLFGVGAKAGPFKHLAFQALGIQPAVGVAGAEVQGQIAGAPPTAAELGQTALESAAGTAIPLAGMALANPKGVFRGAAAQTDIRANPDLLKAIDTIVQGRHQPTNPTAALPSPEALSQSFETPLGNLTGQEIIDWVKSNTQDPRAEKLVQKVAASGGGVDKLIQGAQAIIDKPISSGTIALPQASVANGGIEEPQDLGPDPWAVVNNHLDLLRSYGRQGRLVANAATQALKDNTLTAPQVYAAFQAGNVLARVLPGTADHRVEFVNKILLDSQAQNALENSGGGQTATGLRVRPTAQADGLIKLALDNNVTAENAAHEGMHVVEDYFRKYDPRTYSLLDRQFKLDDKYTADQVDPGVKRMLQGLQDPNNPGSSAWDAITKRYGLGDNPIEGREWMAYAFGQYDSAITSGMASIPGILPATRRFFNALRNIKEQLGNSLRGMGFRTSQDVFNSVSRGEQRGTSSPVPVGTGAQASTILPFDISTVQGAIAYLKSEGIDDPLKTYGFLDPNDYITTAVRMRADLLKQEPAPIWFSPLSKAVESLKQNKASGEQWLATLSKMPGVKDDELKWTGLEDRLSGSKDTFSKEDILDFLEEKAVQVHDVVLDNPVTGNSKSTKYPQYALPGGENYRELLLTYPDKPGDVFTSSHWPATDNILAHVRFDERADQSGKPTLFLQEIQSDWHQEGREQGYRNEEAIGHIDYDPIGDKNYPWIVKIYGIEYDRTTTKEQADFSLKLGLKRHAREGVPQAPYKSTEAWAGMSMRRMIRWAAEHGFDKIAWTTGEQQADRYSLHHQVDSISVQKVPGEDNYAFTAERHGRNVISRGSVDEAELRTLIGRELADKALTQIKTQQDKQPYIYTVGQRRGVAGAWPVYAVDNHVGGDREPYITDYAATKELAEARAELLNNREKQKEVVLSGLDLKLGGEGMKHFYDTILPKIADKLGKKFGVKTSKTNVPAGGGNFYYKGPSPSGEFGGGWNHFFELVEKDGRGELRRQLAKVVHDVGQGISFQDAMTAHSSMALAEMVGGEMVRVVKFSTVHSLDLTPEMKDSALKQGMPQFSVAREDRIKNLLKGRTPGLSSILPDMTMEERREITNQGAKKLVDLVRSFPVSHKEMAAVGYAGRAKKGWYAKSAEAIQSIFGPYDSPKFAGLLAALSPQVSVETNTENALRTWAGWLRAGRPTDPALINKVLDTSVTGNKGAGSVLPSWRNNAVRALSGEDGEIVRLSGPKVNSFMLNLLNSVNEVTNDTWMANYSGLNVDFIKGRPAPDLPPDKAGPMYGKTPGYIAMSVVTRRAADYLTKTSGEQWTPREVQETVWSWAKALYELRDGRDNGMSRTAKQLLAERGLSPARINSVPDFSSLFLNAVYGKLLNDAGYGKQIRKLGEVSSRGSPSDISDTPEGSGFSEEDYRRHLGRAAGRLEDLRTRRVASSEEKLSAKVGQGRLDLQASVAGENLKGDGRKFTDFFAGVSKGTAGKGTTGKVYEPVLDASSIRPFINEYSKHLGNFDQHIATSIPGYREIQPMVGDAIVHALPAGGKVLDIGGSEGGLAKAITAMSGGKIRSTVLDPNQAMKEAFDSISHVPDTDYALAAFGPEEEEGKHAWTEDNGVEIPYFRPIGKYDVVHESMTFQFISNARAAQIARAKELMKPSGIMVLQEKFNADPGKEDAHKANEAQKDAFKRQYYEQKAMTQKAEQQLVGMHQNMISAGEMERILTSHFKYVSQYWDSGNFKGYVASNNANKFHAFLDALPSTQSAFSKVQTPRAVMDQGDFDVVSSQASIAKAIEDRGFVKDKDSGTIVWGKPIPKAAAELMSGGRMNFGKLVYPVGDQTFGKDHLATNPERLAVLRSLGFRDDEDAARWISKNWSWVNDRNQGSFTLNGLREVAGKKYVLRAAVTNLKDAGRPTDKFAIITIVPSEGVNNTLVWGKHPEVHGAVAEPQKSPAVLSDENIRNHTQASVAAFLGKHFAPDSRSTWDAARRKLQDYFLPVKRYEEAVGKSGEVVPEASSVYLAEELYHTRVGRRLRESEEHLFSPVVEKIAKSGITPKEFGKYLLAKHAEERNIAVAARNPKLPDAGSGMKTQDAIEHLNAISKGPKAVAYEDARKLFANVVNDTTRIRVEGGLIPADAPSKSPFQYYAPLMGWEEDPEGIPPESPRTGGAGFDVRGKESRTFTGRTSTPGDILSHAFMQHQEAIIRSEKNRVGQSLLRLAKDHPDDFDINTVAFEPRYNEKTGLVEYKFDPTSRMAENIIAVKDAGKVHYIAMFDPLFARALKKLGASNTGEFFRAMGKVTNYLSAINTSLSPEFIITNMTRTFIESGINISRKEIDGLAFKVMKGVPAAMKGGFDSMISGTDTPMARLHKQMMLDGGGVEFMGLSDLRSQESRIRDLFNKWDPNRGITGSARVGWNALWKFVRDSNHVVEGATRLSMYNEALKIGMSRPQAAHLAKNINLNFSRKGEWGPAINSMFMFYNAAAQTAATMFNSLKSARVRKIVASMVLMSAAMEYLNQSTAPTGPDGQSMYDKLEEQKKDFNLIIPSFFGTADHYHPITLPLPIGYRVFHLIGRNIAAAMFFHKAPYEAAKDMLDYGIESFNPLGGSATGIGHFLPTLARPFIDLAANKDYLGRPIVPAQNPFGLQKPQSQLAWSNTSAIPKGIAQGLNAMSGGTQVRPGAIDISPETLTYLFNFITGSTGGMVNRIKNLGIRGLETVGDLPDSLKPPDDMTVNDVPFVRRLFATVNPHLNQQNFNTALTDVSQAQQEFKNAVRTGDPETVSRIRQEEGNKLALYGQFHMADQQIQHLRANLKRVLASTTLDAASKAAYKTQAEAQVSAILLRVNSAYRRLVIEAS